jgi:drug/metabolite transporter (DMT)-like permease
VIGSIVLDERFSSFDALCAISCLFGVMFVTKPGLLFVYGPRMVVDGDATVQLGVECVCAGAIMAAVSNVLVRKIGKDTHFLVHSVYFGALSSLISPPGLLLFQKILLPSDGDWVASLILLLVGVFAFVGQCLLNQG